MTENKCVCGHLERTHIEGFGHGSARCILCAGEVAIGVTPRNSIKAGHVFKLDNLKLVEDLAVEKGLISPLKIESI